MVGNTLLYFPNYHFITKRAHLKHLLPILIILGKYPSIIDGKVTIIAFTHIKVCTLR